MILRSARTVAVAVLACVAVALAYNLLHGPSYTASVRVLVSPGAADPAAVAQDNGQAARNQAELLGDPGLVLRMVPELASLPHAGGLPGGAPGATAPSRWRRLAASLGLIEAAYPRQAFAARLSHGLRVRAVGDTDVILVSLSWPDPDFAAAALNRILAGYEHAVSDASDARRAWRLAAAGQAQAQARLAEIDQRLSAAQAGGDAASQRRLRDSTQAALEAARTQADGIRVERALAARKRDAVDRAFHGGGWVDSPDAEDSPAGAPALQQSFVDLLDKRQTLLARLPADNPKVRAIDAQIGRVREENYQAVRQRLTARLAGLDDRLAQANAGIAEDEARLRELDAHLSELALLTQSRAADAGLEEEAARAAEAARRRFDPAWMQAAGTRVLSAAMPPVQPDWPGPDMVLRLAAGCGLALGLAVAAWSERSRRHIDTPADIVRHLGIEVLAQLEDYS